MENKNKNKNMIKQRKDQEEVNKEISVSRRQFFKKAAYAAPSLVVLGSLMHPTVAFGSDTTSTSFGRPGGGL